MKTFDRILLKVIIVQFIFLFISQIILHKFHAFPELSQLTQYEGVMTNNNYEETLETFNGK